MIEGHRGGKGANPWWPGRRGRREEAGTGMHLPDHSPVPASSDHLSALSVRLLGDILSVKCKPHCEVNRCKNSYKMGGFYKKQSGCSEHLRAYICSI